MRAIHVLRVMALVLGSLGWTPGVADAPSAGSAGTHRPSRQELIGMWRLACIGLRGPDGVLSDPFYQAGSIGLLVYDAAGTMSVQIAGPNRPAAALPSSRVRPAGGHEARVKAAAFDSYYAYFGTWTYDVANSTVTHHVESSLLPAEIGVDYAQEVAIDGDRLIFTNHDPGHGHPTTRTKLWRRASAAASP